MRISILLMTTLALVGASASGHAASCSANCSGGSCEIENGEQQSRLAKSEGTAREPSPIAQRAGETVFGAGDLGQSRFDAKVLSLTQNRARAVDQLGQEAGKIIDHVSHNVLQGDYNDAVRLFGELKRLSRQSDSPITLSSSGGSIESPIQTNGVSCGCTPSGDPFCTAF